MSNKKVAKKQETALSQEVSSWGKDETVTARDIVIAKILPMQYMSEKVKAGEAKYGEFRDTLNNQLMGDLENPFEVVPLAMEKKWIEYDIMVSKSGQRKKEFKQLIPIQDNPSKEGYNDELPLVDEDGKVERDRVMDFYVLIPSEIETGDAIPYVLSFRRTSLKAGKKLATQMYVKNRISDKPPAAVVMQVSGATKQNDEGEFVVQDVKIARPATNEEINKAYEWYQMIKGGKTKVDESDLKETEEFKPEDAKEFTF